MRLGEVSGLRPNFGLKEAQPRALTNLSCTSLHNFFFVFFFSYRKGDFLPLLHIIHYFGVPLCHPVITEHKQSWVQQPHKNQQIIEPKVQRWGDPTLACWTIPHPGVPLRKKLQVTIPGPNQLPCSAARSFRILNKMPHWHWFRLKTFLNVYKLQPKFAAAS